MQMPKEQRLDVSQSDPKPRFLFQNILLHSLFEFLPVLAIGARNRRKHDGKLTGKLKDIGKNLSAFRAVEVWRCGM